MPNSDLHAIAAGKYEKRLAFLQRKARETPVEEFYLFMNPSEIQRVAEEHFARQAHRLEAWRNGLILLPLLITWLSLSGAASAYSQTYKLSTDPFLKQWADGFPGAHLSFPVLNFVGVAVVDATLIFFLLILTVVAQMIESSANKRAAALSSWLDDKLYELASSSLVKSLGEGSDNKQPAWALEVHTAISHLTQALKSVDSLVTSSQNTLQDLVQNSQTVFNNLVDASQEKLEGSVREFSGAISDQRLAVDKFMSGTTEVRRAVDKLEKIYVEGEHIYQGLNATLPRIDASFQSMSTRQDASAAALETISSQTNLATDAIGAIATQFTQTQLVQSTSQAALQMQQTAEIMSKIAASINETVNRQIHFQTDMEQQAHYKSTQSMKLAQTSKRTTFTRLAGWATTKWSWFTSLPKRLGR